MAECLFVYGSLLPGLAPGPLRAIVGQFRLIGRASLPGRLYDLGPYPGAVLEPSAAMKVMGQVYDLPGEPEVLAVLDAYEGFDPRDPQGSLYVRVRLPVLLSEGEEVPCWVYAYNRDPGNAPLVEGGDYLAWRAAVGGKLPSPRYSGERGRG